jgi:hypothetical protein
MMNRRSFLAAAAAAAFAPATLLRAAEGKRRVVVVGEYRIRGHFSAEFPDANLGRCAQGRIV